MRPFARPALVALLSLSLMPDARAFVHLGGHWPTEDGPVEYYISPQGSDDIADDSEIQAVKYSFRSWDCTQCDDGKYNAIQFVYKGEGPNEAADDDKSSVFWLETAEEWQSQIGADISSTLGVTQHYEGGEGVAYAESDIAFNGTHTWSTDEGASATDVESVSLHETGHFAGLGHPCTGTTEDTCLPVEQAVMYPTYPGGLYRTVLSDDKAGICALYTGRKDACEGKKRLKEACEMDCECESGLYCVPDGEARMCSRPCTTSNASCPKGTGCVIGADGDGDRGFCLRVGTDNKKLDGMVCSRDAECAAGVCRRNTVLNKNVCFTACSADTDCQHGFACRGGSCVLPNAGSGVTCPDESPEPDPLFPLPPGCGGCQQSPEGSVLWALGLVALWRRRRAQPTFNRPHHP
ncbi:MAG: matrixin family metalloprotease [Myxococcota bacterium]